MAREYNLEARYDPHKSFYGKAKVVEEYGAVSLISYKSCICQIQPIGLEKKVKIYDVHDYYGNSLTFSHTSLRHLKEFLTQQGYKAVSKDQIKKDYDVVEGGQVDGFSKSARR